MLYICVYSCDFISMKKDGHSSFLMTSRNPLTNGHPTSSHSAHNGTFHSHQNQHLHMDVDDYQHDDSSDQLYCQPEQPPSLATIQASLQSALQSRLATRLPSVLEGDGGDSDGSELNLPTPPPPPISPLRNILGSESEASSLYGSTHYAQCSYG